MFSKFESHFPNILRTKHREKRAAKLLKEHIASMLQAPEVMKLLSDLDQISHVTDRASIFILLGHFWKSYEGKYNYSILIEGVEHAATSLLLEAIYHSNIKDSSGWLIHIISNYDISDFKLHPNRALDFFETMRLIYLSITSNHQSQANNWKKVENYTDLVAPNAELLKIWKKILTDPSGINDHIFIPQPDPEE